MLPQGRSLACTTPVTERKQGGLRGERRLGTGKKKQIRAQLAGQEVLERPDSAHRKAKGCKEMDLKGGERRGLGTAAEQGRHGREQSRDVSLGSSAAGTGVLPHTLGQFQARDKLWPDSLICKACPT